MPLKDIDKFEGCFVMEWRSKLLMAVTFFGLAGKPANAPSGSNEMKNPELPNKTERLTMQEAQKQGKAASISEYLETMPDNQWRKDTVIINRCNYRSRICLGAYLDHKDSVYMHFFLPDTTNATPQEQKAIMAFINRFNAPHEFEGNKAHEFKHFDYVHTMLNQKWGTLQKSGLVLRADLAPEDIIRLNQHNEISARLATILYQREQYIKTGDLKVFSNWAKQYRKAIEKGIFKPGKMNAYQDELENIYMAKTARDWWVSAEQKVNVFVNRKKLSSWFKYGSRKPEERNVGAYKDVLDATYTYIKDGKLVCLNYFYNPYDFSRQGKKGMPFDEIEKEAATNSAFKIPTTFNKPAVLGDVEPQKKVLDMVPALRHAEDLRLQKAKEAREEAQHKKFEELMQKLAANPQVNTKDSLSKDKLNVAMTVVKQREL